MDKQRKKAIVLHAAIPSDSNNRRNIRSLTNTKGCERIYRRCGR